MKLNIKYIPKRLRFSKVALCDINLDFFLGTSELETSTLASSAGKYE